MAWTIMRSDDSRYDEGSENGIYYEYLCESADDVASLPTGADSSDEMPPRPGSVALIEEDSSIYILKNDRTWGEIMSGNGGGGSGGGVLVVHVTWDDGSHHATLDAKADDIITAMKAGKVINCVDDLLDPSALLDGDSLDLYQVWRAEYDSQTGYTFYLVAHNSQEYYCDPYVAATLDDYPTFTM